MAYEELKGKDVMDVGMEGERGLVAGRSQREKRRSYKDLLREEEEIAAQDAELFMMGGDSHKKKKKHSDDYYYRDHDGSGPPPHKKKHKSADRSPPLSSPSSSHSTDTAMGLLQAITSPLATGSDPSPHLHKKPAYPSFSSHSSKDHKRESSSGSKGSHSFSHSRPLPSSSSSSKKHSSSSSSSKSSLFHGGTPKEEPLTLREADGLKMKVIMSPEKEEAESFPFTPHSSKDKVKKEKDRERAQLKSPKKKLQQSREPLPVVGKEVEVEGHYGGGMGDDSSSSGGELEAGELVIDDSYTHMSKKKKKSKKSKKKKDKEKDRDKDKSGKDRKHSKGFGDSSKGHSHSHPTVTHSAVGPMYAMGTPIPPQHQHQGSDGVMEKKKKKDDKDREKHEKDKDKSKKKTVTTAYQVFCKEYRVNINAEQPGLVFGELSKKLAEVWKAMPEKEKLVWRQKAQYLQHKQNKAEATTVKHKASSEGKSKVVSVGTGMVSPSRAPSTITLSPARVPDVDPIDAAAHLQLLGESLSLIGHRLQETEGMVAVSGSLSVLLDSILCALGPLTCLTAQIPQLNGCPRNVLEDRSTTPNSENGTANRGNSRTGTEVKTSLTMENMKSARKNDIGGVGSDLSEQIKAATKDNHVRAENTQLMLSYQKGQITLVQYKALLCSLYEIYKALEEELDRNSSHPGVAPIYFPQELARLESLERDLEHFFGPDWKERVIVPAATHRYTQRLRTIGRENPELLVAHAYTRYLGDLSGGQVLGKITQKSLGLSSKEGLSFFSFPGVTSPNRFKQLYRARMNSIDLTEEETAAVLKEAVSAFELNIEVFDDLQKMLSIATPAADQPSRKVQTHGLLSQPVMQVAVGLCVALATFGLGIYAL
ncbi:HMG domain-containing protein 4a isoform 2-T2 [Pholidichthys leucotaenia]